MSTCHWVYLAIIVAIIILIIVLYYQRPTVSNFQNVNHQVTGYADSKEPYRMPFIVNKFIDPQKCREIIDYATSKLIDSEVVGGKHQNVRNSQQCWIPKNHVLAEPLFRLASDIFNIPFENAEDLQVVRYLPGQYYNEHHDSCCDHGDKCQEFVNRGGQRVMTVLIYLNNEFQDGETNFPLLNIKLKAATGDAIVFFPLATGSDKCHPKALHAGLPVTSGEKWIANLWYRESNFS